jgi:carbamoyltransferase
VTSTQSVRLGISGATQNACAAVSIDGDILAACEQERVTRARGIGLAPASLPSEAVEQVLALAGCGPQDVTTYVVSEKNVDLPAALHTERIDHHRAHAATAFLTSPFQHAAVIVCDSHSDAQVSVWFGEGTHLEDQQWPWRGCGFARLYSESAALFDDVPRGREHRLEALAHLGQGTSVERLRTMFQYVDGSLRADARWREQLDQMVQAERRRGQPVETASAVQRRLGELLLEFIAEVRAIAGTDALCLGGGLFFNTYFTTLIRRSAIFRDVFVPLNPGNAGLAVGASRMAANEDRDAPAGPAVSPFLGPEFDAEAIKRALDGCKLSYSFVTQNEAIDTAVHALSRGQLVGWFQGRMEWGPRALGHRSILADPRSPYVLDNLNVFLRKRDRSRAFGVSVCEDAVDQYFCGPPVSSFMEYEYGVRDERLRPVMPEGAASIRVQTIPPDRRMFWELHRRMEQCTGTGVLVNTSLNGFNEPLACSPRDAIRVFYGTGLDLLVIGQFVLRK